jgi:hypothetical protein
MPQTMAGWMCWTSRIGEQQQVGTLKALGILPVVKRLSSCPTPWYTATTLGSSPAGTSCPGPALWCSHDNH